MHMETKIPGIAKVIISKKNNTRLPVIKQDCGKNYGVV